MKESMKLLTLVLGVSCLMGCTSPYMAARGHDLADVFTLTVGEGFGAKARVGPVQCGLGIWADSWGLRNGEFSTQDPNYFTVDSSLGELFERCTWGEDRNKDYEAEGLLFVAFPSSGHQIVGGPVHYYTQIEIALGMWKSCRLGFNPGELLDFILGWTTIDILSDDVARRQQKTRVEQSSAKERPEPHSQ